MGVHAAGHETSRELAGRYLVISLLGRGAMGEVYRAYDKAVGREVAVKVLHTDSLQAQERLVEEARAMAKLADPHVVAVYDVVAASNEDRRVLLAMQLVQGQTLGSWLKTERSLSEVLDVFRQAGRGLLAAHRAGIIHRDFKPENVLVTRDGRAFVADFGIASVWHDDASGIAGSDLATLQGRIVGTPWYMAPEQHTGVAADPRADQYAFCLSLWEALARAPLFDNLKEVASLVARKHEPLPPWPRADEVPKQVVRAVYRGLSLHPDDRFPTMAELLDALVVETHRLRFWATAVSATAVVVASGAAWAAWNGERALRCSGAATLLDPAWGTERRDAAEQAVLATGLPYAPDAWAHVGAEVDTFASQWAAMYRDACEATAVRREQTDQVLDLRMACLHRAKLDLQSVSDLLVRADAQVVEKVHEVVGSLPALERCADVEALRAEVAPPEASERDAVESIRAELAAVRVLHEAAKYPDMLARIQPLAERARLVPYPPLQTEVRYVLGQAWEKAAAYPEAMANYKAALRNALAWKQWQLAQACAARLAHVVGREETRPHEGLAYADTAVGLLNPTDLGAHATLRDVRGGILERMGRWAESEAEHRAGLALAEQAWGSNSLDVSAYRGNLGANLSFQGRYAEAEKEQRHQLEVREAALGPRHPDVASVRYNLGYTVYLQGHYAAAEAEARAAVEIWKETLGNDDSRTAAARATLAYALAAQGREVEAEAEYQEALRVQLRIYGPNHLEVAFTAGSFAKTLTNLGRYAEAEVQARDSLRIAMDTYHADHPHLLPARRLLIAVLLRQGRFAEAEAQARSSVATIEKLEGYQHLEVPLTYANLGSALSGQGRVTEAELELRRALAMIQQLPEHAYRGRIHNDLGEVLARLGRLDAAEAEHRKALDLQLRLLDAEHPGVAETRVHLGEVLRTLGRYDDAETELREALAVQERRLGRQHPDLALTHSELGWTLLESGRVREAQIVLERAWAAWRADERVLVPVRAELAAGLGRALAGTEPARARELARSAQRLTQPLHAAL